LTIVHFGQIITALVWESIPRQTQTFAGLARLSCKHDTVNYTPTYGALIPILHFSSALIPILPLIEGLFMDNNLPFLQRCWYSVKHIWR